MSDLLDPDDEKLVAEFSALLEGNEVQEEMDNTLRPAGHVPSGVVQYAYEGAEVWIDTPTGDHIVTLWRERGRIREEARLRLNQEQWENLGVAWFG